MRIGVVAISLVLMTPGSWAGQATPDTPLRIADITRVIGSDRDARDVVAAVLTHAMLGWRREFFLASQLREEWLPAIPGVEIVRLSETAIVDHLLNCGYYWMINRLERTGDVVTVTLRTKCGCSSRDYIVSFDGRDWRLGPPGTGKDGGGWAPGIGSGCVGPQPGCPCLGQ
jgi:hypothetical protein